MYSSSEKIPCNRLSQSGWLLCVVLLATGCASATRHAADVQGGLQADSRVTVGVVQKEVRVGMSGADVATVLGSPNIVSTDEDRNEVWVYDKIATDRVFSTRDGGASVLVLGVGGAAGAESVSQRTLTVVIKFDKGGLVRDFAYHTSRF